MGSGRDHGRLAQWRALEKPREGEAVMQGEYGDDVGELVTM